MSVLAPEPVSTETMPDWHLAQLLHSQGTPLAEIVSRCHVSLASLGKRIQRQGWVSKREELKRGLSVTISSPQAERNESTLAPLATASQNVRRMASDELLSMGHTLTGIKQPKSLKAIDSRLDVLAKLVGVARSTYGWDSSSGMGMLSISSLESMRAPEVLDVSSFAKPMEDIQSSAASAAPAAPSTAQEQACLAVPALPEQTG